MALDWGLPYSNVLTPSYMGARYRDKDSRLSQVVALHGQIQVEADARRVWPSL